MQLKIQASHARDPVWLAFEVQNNRLAFIQDSNIISNYGMHVLVEMWYSYSVFESSPLY
jgi:hypothetical protein